MSAWRLRWNAEKKEYNSKCMLYYPKASLQYIQYIQCQTYIHTYCICLYRGWARIVAGAQEASSLIEVGSE